MASSSPPSDLITQVDPATAFLPTSRPVKKPSTTKRKAKQPDAEKPNPVAEDPAPAAGEPAVAPAEPQAAPENPADGAAAPALSASAPTGDATTNLPVAETAKSEEAAKSPHTAKSANDTPKSARSSQKPLNTTSKQKPDATAPGTPTKLKAKKGFWATLFGALLCTSDSNMDGLHEAALDRKAPAVDDSSDSGSAAAHLKEKEQKPAVHDVEPSQTTVVAGPPSLTKEIEQSRSTEQTANPVLPVDAPSKSPFSPSPDTQIIVPPSPKHTLPMSETEGVMSGSVQAPGSTGEEEESTDGSGFTDEEDHKDAEMEDEDERLILNGGVGIPIGPDGQPRPLLPPVSAAHAGRKCLVLDLDETLLHSSFRLIPQADYVIPVEIEWQWHNVYVIKRPGVDNFLKKMGELYEVVVFTASLSKYADPVLDKLDVHKVVTHRLFRESCYNHKGNYVKDLSQLGRPMTGTIILDNSPASYIFHPNNAVPVSSWFNDPHDTELTDLCPFLADLRDVDDVRGVLDGGL